MLFEMVFETAVIVSLADDCPNDLFCACSRYLPISSFTLPNFVSLTKYRSKLAANALYRSSALRSAAREHGYVSFLLCVLALNSSTLCATLNAKKIFGLDKSRTTSRRVSCLGLYGEELASYPLLTYVEGTELALCGNIEMMLDLIESLSMSKVSDLM